MIILDAFQTKMWRSSLKKFRTVLEFVAEKANWKEKSKT